jgi:hypothetical protein
MHPIAFDKQITILTADSASYLGQAQQKSKTAPAFSAADASINSSVVRSLSPLKD